GDCRGDRGQGTGGVVDPGGHVRLPEGGPPGALPSGLGERDLGVEHATEVDAAEHHEEQDRQDERELDRDRTAVTLSPGDTPGAVVNGWGHQRPAGIRLNRASTLRPSRVTAARTATAISEAMRLYSMEVAPSSLRQNMRVTPSILTASNVVVGGNDPRWPSMGG